ncbi:Sec-independent protein translocase protein TatB [Corynebacterium sp. LK2510]|uniref:Sec-independent protein translocase protein TatB n=1 Tax=Corynebacterium sp. LK2510 TaxID=3110472 RepID=UPI0034D00548
MFSSIGWGEIFFVLIIGLIVIGPERLPGVVQDVRAAIYAARKAINNAKKELESETGFEEFEQFRKPLNTVTEYAAMGPRRAVAKVLFDDPASDFDGPDSPDPRQRLDETPRNQGGSTRLSRPASPPQPEPPQSEPRQRPGFSWEDVL